MTLPVQFLRRTGKAVSILLLLLSCRAVQAQGVWSQVASMPASVALSDCASFTIGSYAYCGTGFAPPFGGSQEFWRYDPSLNVWTQMSSFPGVARWQAVALVLNNKAYVLCGFDPVTSSHPGDVWEYDPVTNGWLQKANFPGGNRHDPTAFVVGGKGYIATGQNVNYVPTDRVWEYDASTDTWAQRNNFGGGVRYAMASFVIEGEAYMGTGTGSFALDYADFWKYDHINDSWMQVASMPGPARNDAVAFAICGYGYVGTGDKGSADSLFHDFYRYEAASNTWITIPDFPGLPRGEASAFVVGEKAFVGTGHSSQYCLLDFYLYDWQDTCGKTGINDPAGELFSIHVFPNPFTEQVTITLNKRVKNASFNLYDLSGKKQETQCVSGDKFMFLRKDLPAGLYLWDLMQENKSLGSGKIVIE